MDHSSSACCTLRGVQRGRDFIDPTAAPQIRHDLLIACAAVQRVCSPVDLCVTLGEKTGRGREEMHSREKSEADEILYNQSSLHFQASGELSGVSHSNVMYNF
ncbi:Hypothetical protein SMAX5B_011023 [Scophthalmus maximus]|uniref:Uncharacterized protein n=1 Tax=Scophthalmus maximus TaxID=52904 RepID=A0A2U9BSZ6_SCOMX|nr:Hypothetical protein SMAX5B_011023 [Scophthalmus maximus]